MDPALLRFGRLKPFMVGLPDAAARRQLIALALNGLDEASRLGEIDYNPYVAATEGCTGAEVAAFVQEAQEEAVKEGGVLKLEQRHFDAARSSITRAVSNADLQRYVEWGRQGRS